MSEITEDFDISRLNQAWKVSLDDFFEDFLALFFPSVYEVIDWTHEPEIIEDKLTQFGTSSPGKKTDDDRYNLYKVRLLNRKKPDCLINIHIQNQYDPDFEEWMYICHNRAVDLKHGEVLSIAILGDKDPNWRPNTYISSILNDEITFKFLTVKILDYESRWDELESMDNAFAIITMAHIKTLATINNPLERKKWKLHIAKNILGRETID